MSGWLAGYLNGLTGGKLTAVRTALKTALALVKGDVGLGSVDNTPDASKPVSAAQQLALDLKANSATPTFTGTETHNGLTFLYSGVGTVVFEIGDQSGASSNPTIDLHSGSIPVNYNVRGQASGGDSNSGTGTMTWTCGAFKATGAYSTTTASAANMFVDTDGTLKRSTSSKESKSDVEDMDAARALALISAFRGVWYRSKCAGDNPDWSWYGAIAEELAEIDPRFVQWQTHELVDEEFERTWEDVERYVERVERVPETVEVINEKTGKKTKGTLYRDVPIYADRKVKRGKSDSRKVLRPLPAPRPVGIAYERLTVPLMIGLQSVFERLDAIEQRLQAAFDERPPPARPGG